MLICNKCFDEGQKFEQLLEEGWDEFAEKRKHLWMGPIFIKEVFEEEKKVSIEEIMYLDIDYSMDEFLKDLIPSSKDKNALDKMDGFLDGEFSSEEEIIEWLYKNDVE